MRNLSLRRQRHADADVTVAKNTSTLYGMRVGSEGETMTGCLAREGGSQTEHIAIFNRT